MVSVSPELSVSQRAWLIKGKVRLFTVNTVLGPWQETAATPKSTNILPKMPVYASEVNISLFAHSLKYFIRLCNPASKSNVQLFLFIFFLLEVQWRKRGGGSFSAEMVSLIGWNNFLEVISQLCLSHLKPINHKLSGKKPYLELRNVEGLYVPAVAAANWAW